MKKETDYYKTKESVLEYVEMAKNINGAEIIEKLKPYLNEKSQILELGSGPGSDWEIFNQDYQIIGSDYSQEFLNHLKRKYPEGSFIALDAITMQLDKVFDAIYSNKVLQHLTDDDLKISIDRQYKILNTNGIICHSFWKGEGSEIFKGLLVNYQNEQSLKEMLSEKFTILHIETYKEFDDGDSIFLIAKKN